MSDLYYLHLCISARLALGDLVEIDRELSEFNGSGQTWFIMVKHALISAANVTDLERTMRVIYKEAPDAAVQYKALEKKLKFAKYLRNILVGHVDESLVAKAIEWKPELLFILSNDEPTTTVLINEWLLETAINTYVDDQGVHRIFGGDTDMSYPPDHERFLIFLTEVIRGGITFLKAVVQATRNHMTPPPGDWEGKLSLFVAAGATEFKHITKG